MPSIIAAQKAILVTALHDKISLGIQLASMKARRDGLVEKQVLLVQLGMMTLNALDSDIEALEARIAEYEEEYGRLDYVIEVAKSAILQDQAVPA